jgi:hypothetical protein
VDQPHANAARVTTSRPPSRVRGSAGINARGDSILDSERCHAHPNRMRAPQPEALAKSPAHWAARLAVRAFARASLTLRVSMDRCRFVCQALSAGLARPCSAEPRA